MKQAFQAAVLNRRKLQNQLNNEAYFAIGGISKCRNNDVDYTFRQESNFLYFTAHHETGAYLYIDSKHDVLFIPKPSELFQVWIGGAPDLNKIKKEHQFSQVLYCDQAEAFLKKNHKKQKILCDSTALKTLKKLKPSVSNVLKSNDLLRELRSIKNSSEINCMKKASQISSAAHIEVMKNMKHFNFEYEAKACFENYAMSQSLDHLAYPSICATGKNAAILHYEKKHSPLKKGQLFLIDAGAEFSGYAADITRTYPISGKFTQKQKDIYNIVLNTQEACIKAVKAGIWLSEVHDLSVYHLTEGLLRLNLLTGNLSDLIEQKVYKLFYPHGLSHTLGLDVHDTTPKIKKRKKQSIRSEIFLKENVVITIEPGLYFIDILLDNPKNRKKYKKYINWKKVDQYRQVGGIRIEDDIVVKRNGHLNLTSVPKTYSDIEDVMNSK